MSSVSGTSDILGIISTLYTRYIWRYLYIQTAEWKRTLDHNVHLNVKYFELIQWCIKSS
jgi:hypothetical protein